MARAQVEAQDLFDLSGKVSDTVEEFITIKAELEKALVDVQQSWRDQVSEKFAEEYADMVNLIENAVEKLEPQVSVLKKEAELIEEYGSVRR
jgi:uncharacterized protein YukE